MSDMNPTGEWKEYSKFVVSTMERHESANARHETEIGVLREKVSALRVEFHQKTGDLQAAFERKAGELHTDFEKKVEEVRLDFHNNEVSRLNEELRLSKEAIREVSASTSIAIDADGIIRDHKVDSLFAGWDKVQWAVIIGIIGIIFFVIEVIVKPLVERGGGG